KSQSEPRKCYRVKLSGGRYACECEDFLNGKKCKHIYAVTYYLMLRDLRANMHLSGQNLSCPSCGCDLSNAVRAGRRYNKSGVVQRYRCKKCGTYFRDPRGFKWLRFSPDVIAAALDLYCRGLSLRSVAEHLESTYGVKVSYGTIYSWLKKYVEIVHRYTSQIRGEHGDRWHADETVLRVRGRDLLLWTILDYETRFLLAHHISIHKDSNEAHKVVEEAARKAGKIAWEIVTDGNPAYFDAIRQEHMEHPVIHVVGPLAGPVSNNASERLNQMIKRRAKNAVHFNSEQGAELFVKSFEVFYNFIKPHRSINYATPAEKAGASKRASWLDLLISSKHHVKRADEKREPGS
ncbi:MAG: IS6 family transposase, partial [Nitrososphaerota archaeon]